MSEERDRRIGKQGDPLPQFVPDFPGIPHSPKHPQTVATYKGREKRLQIASAQLLGTPRSVEHRCRKPHSSGTLLYNTAAPHPSAGIQEAKQDSPTFPILLPFKCTFLR